MSRDAHHDRIPLTVIGGFLGAGKTTLLNHLLRGADGRRLAVLVNDFGSLNVDAELVERRGAELIGLANGCVCCSIGGDLAEALMRVLDAEPRPDAIVIEASGVSDPWRIAQVGLVDPALSLDAVLVLVDASAVRKHAADPLLQDTIERQLKAAGLLVLNKCDQVDAADLRELHAWLDARVPGTPRFETTDAQVPYELLGSAGARCEVHETPETVRLPGPQGGLRSLHPQLFDSCSLPVPGRFRSAALRALLKQVPPGVLRLKGLVCTEDQGWSVLQFAGRHGSLRPCRDPAAVPAVPATLVAIGPRGHLPIEALHAALEAARYPMEEAA